MSENLKNSGNVFDTYYVKGETVSWWVPLSFALFGIINSILIAQSLLFSNLKMGEFLSWSSNISNQYGLEAERSVGNSTYGLTEKKGDPAKLIEAELISGEKILETAINPDIKPKSSLAPSCQPLFFFTFSKAGTTPNVHNLTLEINRLSSWLRQHPDKKVFVEGHTDSYGTEEYNLLLSYRRAKAAEKTLIEAGISKNQVITRAFGDQEPLQGQPTQSKKNRRVSIRVEATQGCINSLINRNSNE
jgi:outer membrane protein OmpA-like peptidoglycan-associated protein